MVFQAPLIPKEISDKFLAKKQRLASKLTSIADSINHSQSSLGKFEKQIENYKTLTQNLNDNVKDAIDNIEKKHKSLNRKLSQVKDAVHIAENEMTEVVNDFDQRMSSNDIFMPSCNQGKVIPPDVSQVSKAKLAQEKLATPYNRVAPPTAKVKEPEKTIQKDVPKKEEPLITEAINPEAEYANKMAKDSFNGMKNMMKSVFKGDHKVEKAKVPERVEIKKGKDEPLSMAERLKMAQNNH